MTDQTKFTLTEDRIPTHWVNLGLSGHGHSDMSASESYLAGKLEDPEFSEADMEAALERLPDAPAIA